MKIASGVAIMICASTAVVMGWIVSRRTPAKAKTAALPAVAAIASQPSDPASFITVDPPVPPPRAPSYAPSSNRGGVPVPPDSSPASAPAIYQDRVLHRYLDDPELNPRKKVPSESNAARLLVIVEEWGRETKAARAEFDALLASEVEARLARGEGEVFETPEAYRAAVEAGYNSNAADLRVQRVALNLTGSRVTVIRVKLGETEELDRAWTINNALNDSLRDRVRTFIEQLP